jgi:hypothetical protein
MNSSSNPPPVLRSDLPGNVALHFLLMGAGAYGMSLVAHRENVFSPLFLTIFSSVCMALLAALGARLLFRHRHWSIRLIAALFALVMGLVALSVLTAGQYGLTLVWGFKTFDRLGLAQLTSGTAVLLLALEAWSQPRILLDEDPYPYTPEPASVSVATPAPRRGARLKAPRAVSRQAKKGSVGLKVIDARRQPRKARLHGMQAQVQIEAAAEEHRCPFCLEVVQPGTPSVECDICHAVHHKDCWDVTGTCQVPHLN